MTYRMTAAALLTTSLLLSACGKKEEAVAPADANVSDVSAVQASEPAVAEAVVDEAAPPPPADVVATDPADVAQGRDGTTAPAGNAAAGAEQGRDGATAQ